MNICVRLNRERFSKCLQVRTAGPDLWDPIPELNRRLRPFVSNTIDSADDEIPELGCDAGQREVVAARFAQPSPEAGLVLLQDLAPGSRAAGQEDCLAV